MIRFTLYWLIAIVWLAVALPILLWSLMIIEVPLWPDFGSESTAEGVTVWAVYTAFFYATPVLLLFNKKAGRVPSKKVANAQD